MRVAVIGAGHIGGIHLDAYRSCSGAEIVSVCDVDLDRAKAAAGTFGGHAYAAAPEMLANEAIDAVSVCTAGHENGSHHFEPVMQCIEAGKHVLCEKPLSNSVDEARQMVAAARAKRVSFGCDLNHRFTPQAQEAKDWVDTGRLGTLLLANVTLWIDNPNDRSPWWHMRALHPHSLDVMRYYCGRAVRVHAFFNRSPRAEPGGARILRANSQDGKRMCWSSAQVNILFENGIVGHLTGSYEGNMRLDLERCEVMGTEGRFVLDNCYQRLTFYPRHGNELAVIPNDLFWGIPNFDATITRRVHRWIEQLSGGAKPGDIEASGEDGLAVQEIIEAAIESWEGDTVVDVRA